VRIQFRTRAGSPDATQEVVDVDQLEERPGADADPATLLAAELGAEVVED
jgi:hypothetical protein